MIKELVELTKKVQQEQYEEIKKQAEDLLLDKDFTSKIEMLCRKEASKGNFTATYKLSENDNHSVACKALAMLGFNLDYNQYTNEIKLNWLVQI